MKITKIKRQPNSVTITRVDAQGPNETEITLRSFEQPAASFDDALRAFVDLVLTLLKLPDAYRENFRVTGLSVNYEEADERMGLVVTCQKQLPDANAPLVLNTPHLREPIEGETGPGFFIAGWESALDTALGEAVKFVNGTRAQRDLFADQHEAAEEQKFEKARGRRGGLHAV